MGHWDWDHLPPREDRAWQYMWEKCQNPGCEIKRIDRLVGGSGGHNHLYVRRLLPSSHVHVHAPQTHAYITSARLLGAFRIKWDGLNRH